MGVANGSMEATGSRRVYLPYVVTELPDLVAEGFIILFMYYG